MTTILCTLYNSLYLDKGLVLYDSLCECAKDFKLYVLCMDDKSYEVLTDLKQEHHILVRLADFEAGDDELLAAKANRPMGEYCWTCSSSFIRYVLMHYNEDCCTYVDADMYFYHDPQILINEMIKAGKSVIVVPHRFPEEKKELAKTVGTFCVEFNTFLKTPESIEVLEYWRGRCLECCSNLGDGVHWGDQKYLDELVEKFECVHICENPGAGVAPWNLTLYNVIETDTLLRFIPSRERLKTVFFHYQSISYISRNTVTIGIPKKVSIDKSVLNNYYLPYLRRLDSKKSFLLEKYGILTIVQGHPTTKHRFVRFKKTFIGKVLLLLYKKFNNDQIIISI